LPQRPVNPPYRGVDHIKRLLMPEHQIVNYRLGLLRPDNALRQQAQPLQISVLIRHAPLPTENLSRPDYSQQHAKTGRSSKLLAVGRAPRV
jgi:hypothetical protein